MTLEDLYQKLHNSVVKVISITETTETGTGYVISRDGYIITCHHVIDRASKIQIILNSSLTPVDVKCISYDTNCDIAILKADILFNDLFSIGDSKDIKVGERILLLGFPLVSGQHTQSDPSLFESVVSNVNQNYFTIKGVAGIGSSGGPAFSLSQGAIIGTVAKELTYISINNENYPTGDVTFAIPTNRYFDLIRETVQGYKQVSSRDQILQFKQKVVGIYSALGFETKTDVSLGGGDKLDIFATTRLAGTKVSLGISCLYKNGLVDVDEIKKFYTSILMASPKDLSIHKGIIVSNAPFSLEAKETASRNGIDLISFQELSCQMVDFQSYLSQLIRSFEELPFYSYMIDGPCSVDKDYYKGIVLNSVFDYVRDVLLKNEFSHIAFLGNFGMGKTAFVHKLSAHLAKKYLESPTENKIPILVQLKEHKAGTSIEETIVRALQISYGVNWDIRTFSFLKRNGQLIFLLDGLDEMAAKVDRVSINENLREIFDLAEGRNTVLFSCRTHFFFSVIDEGKLRNFKYIYLLPWRKQELITYLQKRTPNSWETVLSRIQNVFNLEELAQTPIFLEMIVETLQRIEKLDTTINSSDLYDYYTQKWMYQQEIRRGSVLTSEQKEQLMLILAYEMLKRDELRINYNDLNSILRDQLNISDINLAEVSNDIRTCSFLVRDGDYYRFSHTSFMEFFVAKKYYKELLDAKVSDFGKVYYKEEVFFFLQGLLNKDEDKGVRHLEKFLNSCPMEKSRARIHTVFLLSDIGTKEAEDVLWDILKNDKHSRVSGHAAEALYRKFNKEDAFHQLIASLELHGEKRDISLPKEPDIGWYSVGGSRVFSVDNSEITRFFIKSLKDPVGGDLNLKWYATSVLSRITNLREVISTEDLEILVDILINDKIPRARAYAATILGNLGFFEPWIISSLERARSMDVDASVRKASDTSINLLNSVQ